MLQTIAVVPDLEATSVAQSDWKGRATLEVRGAAPLRVRITPSQLELPRRGSRTLVATVLGSTDTRVTWSASAGTIDASGNYTAPDSLGTFTVRATSVADDTAYGVATVVVRAQAGADKTFAYDLNGNMISDGEKTFEWDAENRLMAVNVLATGHRSEFSYDGMGRRVVIREFDDEAVVSDKKYLWDGVDIAEELATDGTTLLKSFYTQGFVDADGTKLFYTRDHLGSVRELTDNTQTVRTRYDYDPYGRMTKIQGDRDSQFGYTGHLWHEASGLNLAMYRAYDPNLGRWINRDPIHDQSYLVPLETYVNSVVGIGITVGRSIYKRASSIASGGNMNSIKNEIFNHYSYVSGNPINLLDYLGLKSSPFDECDPKKHCKDKKPYTGENCLDCCNAARVRCMNGDGEDWWEKLVGLFGGTLGRKYKCGAATKECMAKCAKKESDPLGSDGVDE